MGFLVPQRLKNDPRRLNEKMWTGTPETEEPSLPFEFNDNFHCSSVVMSWPTMEHKMKTPKLLESGVS